MNILDRLFPSRVKARERMEKVREARRVVQDRFDTFSQTIRLDSTDPEFRAIIESAKKEGA